MTIFKVFYYFALLKGMPGGCLNLDPYHVISNGCRKPGKMIILDQVVTDEGVLIKPIGLQSFDYPSNALINRAHLKIKTKVKSSKGIQHIK